ncbi:large-conductance mechanosensitive channel protein MscL [Flavobacteriaceae bacterium]|jgi:large conductance mechanosensitive channel|nr:large-conductance mechanosensitive channel protein MscL [Flavobacteriaceae bacterium]MDB4025411.1 large-conductance mechanosensitive channel protein MscL [Flavobacteriaceae bacterium]MDB4228265.1 large-conductance mechanosensitive channel protein MscL [Flavobacteriaceae bacterium]MDB9781027.1 large-conductance mechanosensitive channel protein MscL [Flavobacteriaceae bacterium]MDB9798588.1 large-conductance mechanosensitive channel protein MscL [Flavobacteriaceae bacterium]|tara:strand:- start:253 stop:651 length:399 start_codon:yes stop_codon:yes gene_type:complete
MLKEFKEFALKGNLVDIAIGFVMGAAFKQVVTSFTGGIVSPLIGLVFKADFKDLKWIAREADTSNNISEVAVLYGDFITNVIDFVIVAFVMFIIIKGINATKKKEAPAAPALPAGPTQEELLEEIRDLLAKK